MTNTAACTLMRRASARPGTGQACLRPIGPPNALFNARDISRNVARARLVAAPTNAPYSTRPVSQRYPRSSLMPTPPRLPLSLSHGLQAFHTSPAVHKVKKKDEKPKHDRASADTSTDGSTDGSTDSDSKWKHPPPNPETPLDFADVNSRLSMHAEHFKLAFKRLQTGGRFHADVVGTLGVVVDKKAGTAYPLRELAQIVPRGGRTVSLLVHDVEYVKPIMSAVQRSPEFNQQPQRDPDNELELILKVEPETRDNMVKRMRAVAHDWHERIQLVRQRRDKLHATWKKNGLVGPDLRRTADKELQKIIKNAIDEATNLKKSAIDAIEAK
ncbi:ribosome recycling factor [Xylaria intraflava]|nr:ribosome recycling factor [Xylaria intraflava]